VLLSVLKKANMFEASKGFIPCYGNLKDDFGFKYHLNDSVNNHYKEIVLACKQKNVELIFYTSPYYNSNGNNAILKSNLPNYFDFSHVFDGNKSLFKDNSHLNEKGSEIFTEFFVSTFFTN
jgi:hypothetical protein